MQKIKIVINSGGVVESVYVSAEMAKNTMVEVIDFCTDDEAEIKAADEQMEELKGEIERKELKAIY